MGTTVGGSVFCGTVGGGDDITAPVTGTTVGGSVFCGTVGVTKLKGGGVGIMLPLGAGVPCEVRGGILGDGGGPPFGGGP